jgi:hypothetical protein
MKTDGYEIFDYSDDMFTEAWDYLYDASALQMVDPYLRMKLKDTPIYNLMYYYVYGGHENSFASDAMKNIIRNLIVLDIDSLMYLYYITKPSLTIGEDDFTSHRTNFLNFLKNSYLPYYEKGRNARVRLGISKYKEQILIQYPSPSILKYPSRVFDDDISFLTAAVSTCTRPLNTLASILTIKEANPSLTYEKIIRTAIFMNLESPKVIRFEEAINNLLSLVGCRKELMKTGFDNPLRLTTTVPISPTKFKSVEEIAPNFIVKNASVYPIQNEYALSYANALSNAYSLDYINQALAVNNQFYLIVKHGKYYLCEQKDGIVIGIKNNGKDSLVDIEYKKGNV